MQAFRRVAPDGRDLAHTPQPKPRRQTAQVRLCRQPPT